jgi:transcriptional regulator with XRE-family HTH domain
MPDTISPVDRGEVSRNVGARLRAVRRQRRLSLDDVERTSGGRWSASAVGAYERGFRNLSLPRLRDLAEYYNVPIAVLLADPAPAAGEPGARRGGVALDLTALERATAPEALPVMAFAREVARRRGDWNGRVLSIRESDVSVLAWGMGLDERAFIQRLGDWDVLVVDVRTFLGESEGTVPPG